MQTIPIELENDDGDSEAYDLPARWEICDGCRGNGTHVNPAIDGHGISQAEFDEDPDFEEAYFSGHYDVRCDECNGAGKILVPDEDQIKRAGLEDALARWNEHCESEARERAADRHTRWMESGGRYDY